MELLKNLKDEDIMVTVEALQVLLARESYIFKVLYLARIYEEEQQQYDVSKTYGLKNISKLCL